MMRIVMTGGTGFIGRALANSLAGDGQDVIVLSRNRYKTAGLDARVQVVQWDAQTVDGWGHLVDGAGAVLNLVGESIAGAGFPPSRWTAERKKRIRESRLNAGAALVAAIRSAQVKPSVFMQSSAVGYYGTRGAEPISESEPAGMDFLGRLCVEWEASTAEVEKLGVRRVLIRTGLVLSTQGGVLPLMALPFRFFVGGPIGNGEQQIPWIHLDDEIAAIKFLLNHPEAKGAYNLAAPNPLSNAQFSQALGKAMRRPAFFVTPSMAFKLAFGELSMLLLEGQRAVPTRLLAAGYAFQYPTADAALADLFHNHK